MTRIHLFVNLLKGISNLDDFPLINRNHFPGISLEKLIAMGGHPLVIGLHNRGIQFGFIHALNLSLKHISRKPISASP